jgi:hypothetical protein
MTDFFISYTGTDESWAEWIAWTLGAADFTVIIQKWDFKAGSNFALQMHHATSCKRTIAVLSPDYLTKSSYGAPEWAAAFANDPEGSKRTLVPVRVAECKPEGLLKAVIYIDLVGKIEDEARRILLDEVDRRRAKPSSKPDFPGKRAVSDAPPFPGWRSVAARRERPADHYMPKFKRAPSDLEKRQFIKSAFETIRRGFDSRLHELAAANLGVETDLTPVDATAFTAEIFINGQSRAQCRIWQRGIHSEGISYAEDQRCEARLPATRC